MLSAMFDSSTLPLLQKVAAFTERRQEVLAGNVANISTPGYKSRDLPLASFQDALNDAVNRRRQNLESPTPHWSFDGTRGVNDLFPAELFESVEPQNVDATFQDGNNRNVEAEMMEATKNALLQNIAIELMSAQFNRLQAVISERA